MNKKRIILSLIVGFVIAMILMSIAIYWGYCRAYEGDSSEYIVRIICIPIYRLTKIEDYYQGESIGPAMGLICGICMTLSVTIDELMVSIKGKK